MIPVELLDAMFSSESRSLPEVLSRDVLLTGSSSVNKTSHVLVMSDSGEELFSDCAQVQVGDLASGSGLALRLATSLLNSVQEVSD